MADIDLSDLDPQIKDGIFAFQAFDDIMEAGMYLHMAVAACMEEAGPTLGLECGADTDPPLRCIVTRQLSDGAQPGALSRVAAALDAEGIAFRVCSGAREEMFFVPEARGDRALERIRALARG